MFSKLEKTILLLLAARITAVVSILSPCSRVMSCPKSTDLIGSGSGDDGSVDYSEVSPSSPKYMININEEISAWGKILIVKLQFEKCIPFNINERNGPKWYKIEAISKDTGTTTGEFLTTPFNSESESCSQDNTIKFYTTTPTVLDLPRKYQWKPMEKISEVCFRVTLLHNGQRNCTTIMKCHSVPDNPVSSLSTPAPTQSYKVEPSPKKRAKCEQRWNCADPKFRSVEYCVCDPAEKPYCKTYSKKCLIKLEECLYKIDLMEHATRGQCQVQPTTPPPSSSPTPEPVPSPPPIIGHCKQYPNTYSVCSATGDFKLTQCQLLSNGKYECYCVRYDFGIKLASTKKLITSCESPDTYDLGCIRQ